MARIGRTYPARPLIGKPVPVPPPPLPFNPAVFQFSAPHLAWQFGVPQTAP